MSQMNDILLECKKCKKRLVFVNPQHWLYTFIRYFGEYEITDELARHKTISQKKPYLHKPKRLGYYTCTTCNKTINN
jgi:hypothetical protein